MSYCAGFKTHVSELCALAIVENIVCGSVTFPASRCNFSPPQSSLFLPVFIYKLRIVSSRVCEGFLCVCTFRMVCRYYYCCCCYYYKYPIDGPVNLYGQPEEPTENKNACDVRCPKWRDIPNSPTWSKQPENSRQNLIDQSVASLTPEEWVNMVLNVHRNHKAY